MTEENKGRYTQQKKLCAALLPKSKKEYFNNLNEKNACNNNNFWKVVKPLLSYKVFSNEKEGDKVKKSDKETAKVLNGFFRNVATNINNP